MSKTASVKWAKNTYEISLPPTLAALKEELQTLTNIPPLRQKILCKGKSISDDDSYSGLSDKSVLMLIGSFTSIKVSQSVPISEVQDSLVLPPGFENLGNTCWLNSSLKALYTIPELRTALMDFSTEHGAQNCENHICQHNKAIGGTIPPTIDEINLITSIGNLYKDMTTNIEQKQQDKDVDDVIKPIPLLFNVSKVYPELFNIASQQHEQQDVDEFLTLFITTLGKIFINKEKHLMQELFGITITITVEPISLSTKDEKIPQDDKQAEQTEQAQQAQQAQQAEQDDEKTASTMNDSDAPISSSVITPAIAQTHQISYENWTKLRAEVNVDLSDIQGGIKAALSEVIEKNATIDSRVVLTQFNRKNFIVTLPKYLLVQLQRFQWKKETQSKAKLIRRVNINPSLDLFPFCSPEAQKDIEPYRKTLDELRKETHSAANGSKMDDSIHKTDPIISTPNKSSPGQSSGGYYNLSAIITHQGRSADSGHYVAWTKTNAGNKYESNMLTGMTEKEKEKWKELQTSKAWIKHDDTKSSFSSDKVLTDLAGGGDFHIAYFCIYKAQQGK